MEAGKCGGGQDDSDGIYYFDTGICGGHSLYGSENAQILLLHRIRIVRLRDNRNSFLLPDTAGLFQAEQPGIQRERAGACHDYRSGRRRTDTDKGTD